MCSSDLEAIDSRLAAAVHIAADLKEAVDTAARLTAPGRSVLFSPASPSYGVYKNFEERGNVFRGLVNALSRQPSYKEHP